MWEKIKNILSREGGKCIIVEDNQPTYIVMKLEDYEKISQGDSSEIAEVNRKEEYARSCYKQAEAAAIRAKEIRETAKHKVVNMEQQVKKLQEQLGSARQNIKRRKRQLQELKE